MLKNNENLFKDKKLKKKIKLMTISHLCKLKFKIKFFSNIKAQ